MDARVVSVSLSPTHSFSKIIATEITLRKGLGIEGDAHAGATVRHRYQVRKNPNAPNLCQVHFLQSELFRNLSTRGIEIQPGEMGENVTTVCLDLLNLPLGTHLLLGPAAIVEITGLRDPCKQMDGLRPGLMKACLGRAPDGGKIREAGVMGIVLADGVVRAGDRIVVKLPPGAPRPLGPV